MSWDPVWENVFSSRDWGKYPPLELVRFVARNYYRVPDRKKVRLLEVGCGPGANIWYMAREGFDVSGVDGSPSAIAKAEKYLHGENLRADLKVGDVVRLDEIYPAASFDAVVDVACLWCNRISDVQKMTRQIHTVLKPGGKVFSMLLAEGTYGRESGREVEPGTVVDISAGPLHGTGTNHFFSDVEARSIFSNFSNIQIEFSTYSMDAQEHIFKMWVLQGVKA